MSAYSVALIILALAMLVPLPAYIAYCHLNKKELDNQTIQTISFGLIIPAVTFLAWDDLISSDVVVAICGAAAGFYLSKFLAKKD
jgi:hypothetical protein